MNDYEHDRIKHIFKYMEYDALTEAQEKLVIDYEEFFLDKTTD